MLITGLLVLSSGGSVVDSESGICEGNKPNAYIMKFVSGKDKTGAISADQNTIEWSNPGSTKAALF